MAPSYLLLPIANDTVIPIQQVLHLPSLDETFGALLLGSYMGLLWAISQFVGGPRSSLALILMSSAYME